ncbi:MAG TPA: hypothetical protein VL326_26615 [Kofleriaceae bacterium]|nr:hypothetical protein [Kofleriaceae bacterium]
MSSVFKIPADFRAFMREVAAKVDFGEIGTAVGDNALEHECGRGGRIEKGSQMYRFTYLEKGGYGRWEIELREQQIRDIASGLIEEVEALQLAEGTRANRGDALIVWGEYDDDALRVRTLTELGIALDGMMAASMLAPCLLRLWGTSDQQAIAALNGLDVALYVIASEQGYGRSVGDPTRSETFRIIDHDVGAIDIPWSDVIPWRIARGALLRFVEHGDLGDQVILDGSIPTQFLMLGDYDRQAELATRRPPPQDPAQSSLPQKAPHGEWAKRLLKSMIELQLIEIDMHIVEPILARLAILLILHGDDALDSTESAQKLAKEIERVRGVGALFATGGDLQIALRRTQEPPTAPVEMPFT